MSSNSATLSAESPRTGSLGVDPRGSHPPEIPGTFQDVMQGGSTWESQDTKYPGTSQEVEAH